MKTCQVAIIGAGPYGLSIAAHLKAEGVGFRIFGSPMYTWLNQMPKGMLLKSDGFASYLHDPGAMFTLEHYCRQQGHPYEHTGLPVPLETFAAYGLEFQKRFVPELQDQILASLQRSPSGFELTLGNGEVVTARKVVVAVGITHFGYVPPVLAALPKEFVSHSSSYGALDQFKGREVTVVGAGASALDVAALLHQAGASVQLVARKPAIRFHDPPEKTKPPFLQRMRAPRTGIGLGWKVAFCTYAPVVFHYMPESYRLESVRTVLGPAPGWFIKQQVVGKVPFNLGVSVTEAKVHNGRVSLEIADHAGARRTIESDHVIAATGYKVDLRRLAFLDADLQKSIRSVEQTPVLSSHFESSVPGLYFVGTSAANSFGPLLRFAYGAGFTAPRLTKHLKKSVARTLAPSRSAANTHALESDQVGSR